jgi:RNA polymerase sigma-70 factor (sigma-E family)
VTDRDTGTPPTYREFASARATQLFRIAYLMCGDWHEAEDLVQITLAKVFVSWGRMRRVSNPEGYARKIMLNAFLSQRRLRRSGELPTDEFGDAPAPGVDADLRMTLLSALQQLPPRARAVVVLRYVEDHSIQSVATLMGVSPAAVKSMNTRGLAQLRELLGSEQDLLQP